MAERDQELRANRMDLVSRWADDVAHEIKNPLHAMVINLELVKRRAATGETDALVERVAVLEAELHRVHGLVDSLLRLVRPWADSGTAMVDRVFEDLLPVFRVRARVRKIDFEHEPGGDTVPLAPGRLALVLLNLVDDAVEATPEGGLVRTACRTAGGEVLIAVRDSRSSPPPEDQDPAARPGAADPADRTGPGLAMARSLIEQAGGRLSVAGATDGPGTVVTLVLPVGGTA